MTEANESILRVPPFPPLTWNNYAWEGRALLPAWKGFHDRTDAGQVRVVVLHAENQPPTAEQIAAFRYLIENDKAIADSITEKIMSETQWWQAADDYDDFDLSELCERIEVETVVVHRVSKKGTAYLGFEGSCDWEQEQGLGVLMHLDKVIAIGGADVSFGDWIAREDAQEAE